MCDGNKYRSRVWSLSPPRGWSSWGEKYQLTCRNQTQRAGVSTLRRVGSLLREQRGQPQGEAGAGSTGRLQHAWISACTKAREKLGATPHQARLQPLSPALSAFSSTLHDSSRGRHCYNHSFADEKQRLKEVKRLAQGHTAGQGPEPRLAPYANTSDCSKAAVSRPGCGYP